MARSLFLLLALLSSASADYPVYGNGLIQKDSVKAKAVTPDAFAEEAPPDAYAEEETVATGEDAIAEAKQEIIDGAVEKAEEKPAVHTLNSYITSVLLPRATETKTMLQTDIDNAAQKVRNCALMMEASEPSRQAAEANLNRQQRKLAMCLRVKNGETIKEEEFCEEWHAAAKNFNPKTLDYAKGNLKTYENILKTYYDFYPKFMKEEAKCREMIAIMHSQDKHCSFRVGEITKVYCALKENRTKLCGGYDGCYAGAVSDYEWTRNKATKLEAHTKKTYKALECFKAASDSLSFAKSIDHPVEQDGNKEAVKSIKCDPSQYTTEHLDLQYHDVPLKETCSKEIVAPGKYPSWCQWEPATTATTTIGIASQGPSGGPATAATYSLIQDSANVDTTSFSKVEEYLADAESVLKKMQQ